MTLTHYAQLKAYWFNPSKVKVTLRIRNTRDFGTRWHRRDILVKLATARAKLEHRSPKLDDIERVI